MTDLGLEPVASPDAWAAAMAAMPIPTLEQSWAYGEAVAAVSRFVPERWRIRRGDATVGLAQVFVRRFGPAAAPWCRFVRVVRGPLLARGLAGPERRAALALIRAAYPWAQRCLLWWLPELTGGSEAEEAMAALGMAQMVTGWSTVSLDLTPPPEKLRAALDGKWRNALKAAEKAPISVREAWDDSAFAALMQAHDAQRLEKRFLGPDGAFYRAFAAAARSDLGEQARLFTAHAGLKPVAGMLILRHGTTATYAAGWSGEAGRLVRAHHRLLWQAMLALRADGVRRLDLGGVNTAEGAGVARFKLGLNGEVLTLAGSFL